MKAIQATAKAIGLFVLITSAVTAGVLVAGRVSEVRHDTQQAQARTRALCAEIAHETSKHFDAIKAKCKEMN